MISMDELLKVMAEKKASDLHMTAGAPPTLRVDGEIMQLPYDKLAPDICQRLIYSLLTDKQRERFEATNELDLSFAVRGIGRIRMNVFKQRGAAGSVLRAIPSKFLTFEELNLPPVVYECLKYPKGLILVTGPTGCGKSTTLASMINYLNDQLHAHIITVEDPIEYVHEHRNCIINQREVGSDTNSFSNALKYVLRQDPDIVLVGEMRDLETIAAALTIAETGHLVFATLHTTDAPQTINRIVDVFPPHQQSQIRSQLSTTLMAVFSQQLLLRASGVGRVMACEVLVVTPAIRNLVREQKVEQIPNLLQAGGKHGMQTMNQSLAELVARKAISYDEAMETTMDAEDLKRQFNSQRAVPGMAGSRM